MFATFILGGIINIGYLFRIIDSNFVYFSLLENNQDLGLSVSRLLLNIFVCYLVHKKSGDPILINLFTVEVILLNILSPYGYISRVAYYFISVQILLLPQLKLLKKQLSHRISTVYALVIYCYLIYNNNAGVVPYVVSDYFSK